MPLGNAIYNGTENISFLGPKNLGYSTQKDKGDENNGSIQRRYKKFKLGNLPVYFANTT